MAFSKILSSVLLTPSEKIDSIYTSSLYKLLGNFLSNIKKTHLRFGDTNEVNLQFM